MSKLNCWKCALIAALLSLPMLALQSASAEPFAPQVTEANVVALEQKSADLDEAIVATNAKATELEQRLAELRVALASTEVVTQETTRVANMETIVVTASKSETPPAEVELVTEETFTTTNPAAGWHAWKRQSSEYKKAHPWEKILSDNCARDPRICKRTAPKGTAFYLPATNVRALVPTGTTPPEAIALVPTATPDVFALNPDFPVVTAREKKLADEVKALQIQLERAHARTTSVISIALGVLTFLAVITFVATRRHPRGNDACCPTEKIPPKMGDVSKLNHSPPNPNEQ